jgi:hypothetical protein
MDIDNVRELFPQLYKNGYVPLPNRDKECHLKRWPKIVVDEAQCRKWARSTRWSAIGIRAVPPLLVWDLDLPQVDVCNAIRAILPRVVLAGLERIGNPPKTAFFMRMSGEPFYEMRTRRYTLDDKSFQVEAFAGGGAGKQIGAFGPHSYDDAGNVLKTYTWVGGLSPANVRLCDLPIMSREEVAAVLDQADEVLAAWPGMAVDLKSKKGERGGHKPMYILDDSMVFVDAGGFEYNLEALAAEAKARRKLGLDPLMITGSFLKEPDSKGSPRCRVRWSDTLGVSVTDYKHQATYRSVHAESPLDEASVEFLNQISRSKR